jgi:putative Ca2+/H+ antiporter (TMEM165/GDT1 family)
VEVLTAALTAFVLIVPVELPDKTFVATLVLATRYRALPVWLGVVAAFGVQCLVAVAAGGLIALLPPTPVRLVAAGLFAVGAVILIRGARRADEVEKEQESEFSAKVGGQATVSAARAAGTSFLVLFAAEWGDLSQLLTAGLVARGGHPVGVFLGSWLGLAVVSGAAVLLGRVLLRHVRLSVVRYVGGVVCAILAVVTLFAALET